MLGIPTNRSAPKRRKGARGCCARVHEREAPAHALRARLPPGASQLCNVSVRRSGLRVDSRLAHGHCPLRARARLLLGCSRVRVSSLRSLSSHWHSTGAGERREAVCTVLVPRRSRC